MYIITISYYTNHDEFVCTEAGEPGSYIEALRAATFLEAVVRDDVEIHIVPVSIPVGVA